MNTNIIMSFWTVQVYILSLVPNTLQNKLVVLTTEWLPWLQTSWRDRRAGETDRLERQWLPEVFFGMEV